MFPIVGFLIQQLLGIFNSQVEILKNIFPYWYKFSILSNLRRNQLQFDNFEKLIFESKNWTNNVRVDWKAPSSLIDSEVNLKKELNEFENSFKRGKLKVD